MSAGVGRVAAVTMAATIAAATVTTVVSTSTSVRVFGTLRQPRRHMID